MELFGSSLTADFVSSGNGRERKESGICEEPSPVSLIERMKG